MKNPISSEPVSAIAEAGFLQKKGAVIRSFCRYRRPTSILNF